MSDEKQRFEGFTRVPARVTGCWVPKTVTTDPPRYIPHTEYALAFDIQCDVPLLVALLLIDGEVGDFARPWRSAARLAWELRLSFFPMDWRHSEQVQINFEGLRTTVEHPAMKHDPRPFVATEMLGVGHVVEAGSIVTLASVDAGHRIEARIFLVAKSDTQAKHGRWALKPSLTGSLPGALDFLASGKL